MGNYKKQIFWCIILGAIAVGGVIFASSDVDEIDIIDLENSIIVNSITMNSSDPIDEEYADYELDGEIVYDDSFFYEYPNPFTPLQSENTNENTSESAKEKVKPKENTKENLISSLKKTDSRYHIIEYTIKDGDNLWKIARIHDCDHKDIIRINNIKNADLLAVGKKIYVPSRKGIYHTVKRGDTISELVHKHKMNKKDFLEINKIQGSVIKIGQKLFLPSVNPPAPPIVPIETKTQIANNQNSKKEVTPKAVGNQSSTAGNAKIVANRDSSTTKPKTEPRTQATRDIAFIWPVKGRISSSFGMRKDPFSNARQFHSGIDISVNEGTPIRASESGVVIFSGWREGYGNVVMIRHKYGYVTVYAHNSKNLCAKDNYVEKNSIIAYSGATGNVTGPHLHFEIRKYTTPLNPIRMIR